MATVSNLTVRRTTSYDLSYSDKSVLNFSDYYKVRFIPTFEHSDSSVNVQYILQLQYLDPNTTTWHSDMSVLLSITTPKVSKQLVETVPFTLSNVNANHRKAGTRYRFILTFNVPDETSGTYYTDCLFVPPVLFSMSDTYNWTSGTPWVYTNGQWKQAKSVFVYHDNHWVESISGYPQT